MGTLSYTGWRDLRTAVPANIPQTKRLQPRLASLDFLKFRIWTAPNEEVENFFIYFDQFKVLTDTFETLYDGDALANPTRINELWGTNTPSGQ
jgi:hypothetical protein